MHGGLREFGGLGKSERANIVAVYGVFLCPLARGSATRKQVS